MRTTAPVWTTRCRGVNAWPRLRHEASASSALAAPTPRSTATGSQSGHPANHQRSTPQVGTAVRVVNARVAHWPRTWIRRRARGPWPTRAVVSGPSSSSRSCPTRVTTVRGAGGSTRVVPPLPMPVAMAVSSAPRTKRRRKGSPIRTPRTFSRSTVWLCVVSRPRVTRRLPPGSRTTRRFHQVST
ncbi:hypothetical protein [Ornithinimicrobium kibberense]|uniref:hypothetical protein n=1 Tax=Ornithinimicrobium kibberense TaxID=282060 RepID=UPI00360F5A91